MNLKPIDELFEGFDIIEFPEETDFTSSDFPIWNIIADGKDYQSNNNTDFYDKFNELVQIKKIKKHVIKMYNK